MASRKRLFEEYDNLGSADSPCKAAKIHGMLTNLSPMRSGKYFEGHISDDTTSLRLVGFDTAQQRELAAYHDKGQTVSLQNCKVQKSRFSDQMEILLTQSTQVSTSPRKLQNVVSPKTTADIITLGQLATIQNNQQVSVTAKALRVYEKLEVKPGLYKQDVTLADSTGTVRITLWQDDIGKLDVEQSYHIQNLLVRSYDGSKYLTPPKSGSTITPKDDIGAVEEPEDEEDKNELVDADVIAVPYIAANKICVSCKGKVDSLNEHIGRCTKCSTLQRLDKCSQQLSAKLIVGIQDRSLHLHAFLPMIRRITNDDTITDDTNTDEITTQLLMS